MSETNGVKTIRCLEMRDGNVREKCAREMCERNVRKKCAKEMTGVKTKRWINVINEWGKNHKMSGNA